MNKVIRNNSVNLKKVSNPYIPFEVKLASVPKTPYAPFKIGDPKGHGTEMINTGYEWTMNNQASTNRANTLTFNANNTNYNSWRASDSYPLLVYYGNIWYNSTGAAWIWNTTGTNHFVPNAPAQQIELACKNIEADIIAGMYTDLVITNFTPKYLNDSKYPTSIFIRYIRASIFDSKVIMTAVRKFSQIMAMNEYLSNVSSLFVNRSNLLITQVARRSFIASMELLNGALKQIPIHKDVWQSYSALWDVSFDASKMNSPLVYVTPSVYEFNGEVYENVQNFCTISETASVTSPSLLIAESIVNEVLALDTPDTFITNFLQKNDADYQTWIESVANNYANIFKKLAMTVAAMSQAFQPFIVAMVRVGDKYFSDVLERNPDIRSLIQTKFTEFKDFETMGLVRQYTANIAGGNHGRTVASVVPLFNSFSPIEMFRKNGLLMCKTMEVADDPAASYKAIIDVTNIYPQKIHLWNDCTYDSTHGLFEKTGTASTFGGKHYTVIPTIDSTSNDIKLEANFKISPYAISDLGLLQYLQHSVVSFIVNAESGNKQTYYYNPKLSGFRSVVFPPVLDTLMERAPYVFGVNSELAKAIKA